MNQPVPYQQLATPVEQDDDTVDLASYLDLFFDNRWLILGVAFAVMLIGAAYALTATPIYDANIMIQVEDSAGSSKNILGDLSSVFDLKTAATSEMEIIRSRFVITRAVDNLKSYISIQPKYFPVIGKAFARHNKQLSEPGLLGFGGYVWGAEVAKVSAFNVPESMENEKFVLTAEGNEGFRLTQADEGIDMTGKVGVPLSKQTPRGEIVLQIDRLDAKPGAKFTLIRVPRIDIVEKLQKDLSIAEKGKQSGIIGVSLEGPDAIKTAVTLNEIGHEYIRQNVDRKAEEAEKSLEFLDKQLPDLKQNLESSEAKYNAMRNSRGTVDLSEEAKSILQQSVLTQTRLIELRQKREELLTRFQPENPIVEAITQQLRAVNAEMESVNAKIKKMPSTEQDVFRLTRDVKVNTDLYTSLLNSAQQMRLIKASKVGNARLLDIAVVARKPIRPKPMIVMLLTALIGLFLGVTATFIRKSLFGGIDNPHEIEQRLGLSVNAALPHSEKQEQLYAQIQNKTKKVLVLAQDAPQEFAIESLRSLRTSLQFSMLNAKNNIVMVTGPTPGVGKSFVSVNFATVLGAMGKQVLLVDGDLRKGYLHRYFGLERKNGLSETIAAQVNIGQAIHQNVVENVDFLSSGNFPPRPGELLAHGNFGALMKELSELYDYVIIDTPPVLAVSDAQVVASHVGSIFTTVRGGISTMGEIEESVKRLRQNGHSITGVVFNDLKPRAGRYGYGSKYGKYRYAQYEY